MKTIKTEEEENLDIKKNKEENILINNFYDSNNNLLSRLFKNILTKYFHFKINYLFKNMILLFFCLYIISEIKIEKLYNLNVIKNECNASNNNEIYTNKKKESYLKVKYVNKFNSFINLCMKGFLETKNKYNFHKNPKISVIMPIFNGGKYLYYSLRSIQNQIIKEIEIILIDDCSTDNSLNIIKNYMEEDGRIRLIKNKKSRKILYSKSIAALNSNGKYIIELDQDDMFIRNDCFNILYYEAELNNLDLVHIRDFSKNNFYFKYKTQINLNNEHLIYPQNTNYKNQPKLKEKMFIENNIYLLWGLLIKTDLYKKTIYYLWPIIMNYQLIFHEDYAISFMLVIFAKRYKYLNQFGILHLIHNNSASNNYSDNKNYYLSVLFVSNIIYDYYLENNPKDIKILINYILLFLDCYQYSKKAFPYLYQHILSRILNNNYLSKKEKIDILEKIENNNITYNIYKLNKNLNCITNKKDFYLISNIENTTNINNIFKNEVDISIIIYCNEFKSLTYTIKSLLYQKFKNFEIIIIYDNIELESLSFIKNMIKDLKNIILIDNKNIKGLIYSFSISVLESKGKYVLFLLSGYTLSNEYILIQLYQKITKNNLDILEFHLLINKDDIINIENMRLYKCSHIKSQINLNSIIYNQLNNNIDQEKELLFNKLIKVDILKEIINEYKLIHYKEVIYNYYDDIILFTIMKKVIKFEYINIIGIIQNVNYIKELQLGKIMKDQNQIIKDSIFYINFLFDKSENTFQSKKFVLSEFYNKLSIIYNKFNKISNESIKLLEKFKNSKYINNNDKSELIFYYKSLIN